MVSVVTTLYNYAQYIEENIQSFLSQDFKDSEMIIVDDASVDNPIVNISKYLTQETRIKYIRLEENKGYSHAKNVGIIKSSYEVLVMLDADDLLTRDSISSRFHKLQKGFDFVHGPVLDLKKGKSSPSALWGKWKKSPIYKNVHAQSVMLKKQIHREIGLYDESLRSKSDREMWARIFNRGYKIGTVGNYVSIYRMHDKQMHKSKEKLLINDKLQKEVEEKIERRKHDLSDITFLGK